MKHCIQWLVVVLAMVVFAGSAAAAGVMLINKDNSSYRLFVKHQRTGLHTSIAAKSQTRICSGQCSIRIKGSKVSIQAAEGDTIIIQNGQFKKSR